jgi:RNA polymerase sigma-54 factor
MKPALHLKLSHHLALTPQLQQSIRLLQLSRLELTEELGQLLTDNPLLENDEPDAVGGAHAGGAPGDASPKDAPQNLSEQRGAGEAPLGTSDFGFESSARQHQEGEDDDPFEYQAPTPPCLRNHLIAQLGLLRLPPRDKALAALLIEAIDERGYLEDSLEAVAALLPPELDVDPQELAIALRHVQNFDPAGVGARSPAECLALQLGALPAATPGRELALQLVSGHLLALAARDFAQIRRRLQCDAESLREAHALIRGLSPHPGARFAQDETRYVVPDVVVSRSKNRWVAHLNPDAMPRLRINRMYSDILQDKRHAGSGRLAGQLQEARWLIKSVQQRFDTILRVAQAIVIEQRRFFDYGEVAMRPLVLREIAATLNLHESTVSRVTRQKFMSTPRGIYEFKYFFGSQVATEGGGACSATAIRELMKQLVHAEDRAQPLSDNKIAQLLGQQGIMVARRTVAKYRESIRVPPASARVAMQSR